MTIHMSPPPPKMLGQKTESNKNVFQWDAYRLLVDRIPSCTGQGCVYPSMHWAGGCVSQHALGKGVSAQGGVCPLGVSAWGVCLGGVCPWWCLSKGVSVQGVSAEGCLPRGVSASSPERCIPTCNGTDTALLCGQTDTCENITFANFLCGR